jgi:hypothetical protein
MDADLEHCRGLYILEIPPPPLLERKISAYVIWGPKNICEDGSEKREKCEGKRRKLVTLETLMTCLFHPKGLEYFIKSPQNSFATLWNQLDATKFQPHRTTFIISLREKLLAELMD